MNDMAMVAVIVGSQFVAMLGLGCFLSRRINPAGAGLGHRLDIIEGRITTLLRDVAFLKGHAVLTSTGGDHETSWLAVVTWSLPFDIRTLT